MIKSFNINYNNCSSILCDIGNKYDTDKSSQRSNRNDNNHCHPYTLFYHSIFKNKRFEKLNIAELGILNGASLQMWNEYFPNSIIHGFDNNYDFINICNNKNINNVNLSYIDIKDEKSIIHELGKYNILYDIIIDDTTHDINDQLRIIKNSYKYLKPGGILIIEDIFINNNENDYINNLQELINTEFQNYFFITLDHVNKISTNSNNDKLFILIKAGDEPIFKNNKKLSVITPCSRPHLLTTIAKYMNFNYIDEWIIVYDGNIIPENFNIFKNYRDKIKEFIHKNPSSCVGNSQRNFALDYLLENNKDTFVYFLDDDNIINLDLYSIVNFLDDDKIYSFNQFNRILGNNISLNHIDTAMIIFDFKINKHLRWNIKEYGADGYYFQELYNNNKNKHIYINNDLCYYNTLGNP